MSARPLRTFARYALCATGLLLLTGFSFPAFAQTAPASALMPSPSDTADAANGSYGAYLTWPEIKEKVAGWSRTNPQLVRLGILGKTVEGRDIPLIRISNDASINESEPEVLLMAGIHPREQQPQIALVRLVDELLAGYNKNERITKIINERQIWIIPVLNVDGKVYDMKNGDGKRGADWRKNRKPGPNQTFWRGLEP